MQIDWSTFILEIVNFLILMWLLSRFFYRPVMDIIARRRDDIRRGMEQARQARSEADILRDKYQTRVQDWEREKSAARTELHEAIEQERGRLLQQLRLELDAERQKQEVINRRKLEAERQKYERQALDQGASFCARLLSRLASQDLENSIAALLLEDLAGLDEETRQALNNAGTDKSRAVIIYSAYPPAQSWRTGLEQALNGLLGPDSRYEYRREPGLIAGLRIAIGSRLLQANIQDELKYFNEGAHGAQ